MRLPLALALAALALALAACGGKSNEKSATSTTSPGTNAATGPSGTSGPSGAAARRATRKAARRSRRHPKLHGINRSIYREALADCRTLPLQAAAVRYGARGSTPQAVAQAYAKRKFPAAPMQPAATAGCLAGLPRH